MEPDRFARLKELLLKARDLPKEQWRAFLDDACKDAPELRHMVVRILKALGYRVLEAADGDEALELLLAGTQHVDLVLADVVMPRMGGVELFQRARAHSPQLAFLLTSGYAEEDIGSAIPRQPRVGAIPKPYRLDVLACRIRELLDERA